MSPGAGDDQIDVFVLDQSQQRICRGYIGGSHPLRDDLDAMPPQVLGNVFDTVRCLLVRVAGLGHLDDHDALGLLQQRQRIANGAAGLAGVFPCHGNALERQ